MLEARKRIAIDGKVWWCVFDTYTMTWSTATVFTRYKRKKDCQYAIDKWNEILKEYGLKM